MRQGDNYAEERPTVKGPAQEVEEALIADHCPGNVRELKNGILNPGGLTIFGKHLGAYPVAPTVRLVFKKPHGLGKNCTSDSPVAVAPR